MPSWRQPCCSVSCGSILRSSALVHGLLWTFFFIDTHVCGLWALWYEWVKSPGAGCSDRWDQRTISGVVPQAPPTFFFFSCFWVMMSHWPGTCQIDQVGQSSELLRSPCHASPHMVFYMALGIKLFTDWAISSTFWLPTFPPSLLPWPFLLLSFRFLETGSHGAWAGCLSHVVLSYCEETPQ